MKKLTKQDILRLKFLSKESVLYEAQDVSTVLYELADSLSTNYEALPTWQTLSSISGKLETLSEHLRFLERVT